AVIEWDASPTPKLAAYLVQMEIGDTPWDTKLVATMRVNADARSFRDDKIAPGKVTYYRVAAITGTRQRSDFSPLVRAQPRVADDLFASVVSAKEVRLVWNSVEDAVGYHVERAPVEVFTEDQIVRLKKDTAPLAEPSVGGVKVIGKFERITKEPLKTPAFTDT